MHRNVWRNNIIEVLKLILIHAKTKPVLMGSTTSEILKYYTDNYNVYDLFTNNYIDLR